ncbi:hypothetical protein [Sulfitobacter noctilucicola]|nr:hypothetical protein [Sulfitobacter noctilucicola]
MKQEDNAAQTPSGSKDRRGFSQIIFILIGLGIIGGGLWTLYMGDAPYHPEDVVTRGDTVTVTD